MGFLSQQLSIQIDPSSLSQTGVGEVSSIAIHPGGDNVIVGSREGKLCWFDMDLSSQPHRILKCHPNVVTNVASIVPTLYLRGVLMMAQHIFFMAWCIRVYTRTPLLFH